MANITRFQITNFRGIEKCIIDFDSRISTPVITLVGLNESGKTTILEALSHFVSGDNVVAKLFEGPTAAAQTLSLIPIHRKANFTGTVTIEADIEIDEDDFNVFNRIAKKDYDLELNPAMKGRSISVSKQYSFQDGNFVASKSGNRWSPKIEVQKKRSKSFVPYEAPAEGPSLSSSIWHALIARVPTISYFPTFLVDMPARIYLREHQGETAINRHYRAVLQDVLDSLGEGLSLETHVAKRIEDYRNSDNTPNWFSIFWSTPAKSQIMSVIQKLSNSISREIIGSWSKIFHTPTSAKNITLDFNIDIEKENLPYISFVISDGESQFALHERSLGFRWFFSFLLFTRFKQAKNRKTIFLFDEPAANLHARAQGELLKSFSKIVEGGHRIVYSTHSHYMIEPTWLSGAYIVENKAINYDNASDVGLLTNAQTNVIAVNFRNFVSQYPERVSYYQPILERLDVRESRLIPSKSVVITEGISDFHALMAVVRNKAVDLPFEIIPGQGAGNHGPAISMMLGTGRRFIILLDGDKAGKKEAANYKEKWLLSEQQVCTLGDIKPEFDDKDLEGIIGPEMHDAVSRQFGRSGGKANKKEIGIFFAELQFGQGDIAISQFWNDRVSSILEFLKLRLQPEAVV